MTERLAGITGLGVVTAAGIGIDALWDALVEGRSCIGPISLFDAANFPCSIGGEIQGFSARKFVPKSYRKSVKVMARDIEIAVAAADLAIKDASAITKACDEGEPTVTNDRLGCNIGAGLICTDLDELGMAVNTAVTDGEFDFRKWGKEGLDNLHPLWLLKYLPNMLSCHVTIIHGAEGPSNCITCGAASGHMALGETARYVARGAVDLAFAGGAESKLNPMGLMRQQLLKRLCTTDNDQSDSAARPFDRQHQGLIVGEGGGLLMVEEIDHAKARGARVYAEIAGFGAACDPDGMNVTSPSDGGLALAIRRAMKDANVTPDEVDLIVTHGTGVPGEDALESAAWQKALGERVSSIPAMSITGTIGSLFAGAGGVQLAVAARALQEQLVPPTRNYSAPAEGCSLQFQTDPTAREIRTLVSGAFSVGGQSAVCVLKQA